MPRWIERWPETIRSLERWLLPGECLICQKRSGPADRLVCQVCATRWIEPPWPRCARCGQPLDAETSCRICSDWPPRFVAAESRVWLDPSARRAVHLLKYDGWWRLAEVLGAVVARSPLIERGVVVVPIPLGPARERRRGYNQSAKIAEIVGRERDVAVATGLLARIRETPTQTALTPEERTANVRRAFRARRSVSGSFVLVDDVFTTGATLVAAAEALIEAGAARVTAVTFARAELPLAAAHRALGSDV